MSHHSRGRRAHARRFACVAALGVAAAALGSAAPAHAAGPAKQFEAQIEYRCELVTPYFTVPNLQQFLTLKGTVPSSVAPGERFSITDVSAKMRLRDTGSLAIAWGPDRAQSTLNTLHVSGAGTTGGPVDFADPDVVSAVEPITAGGPGPTFTFPTTGSLPVKALTASTSAASGSAIELRAGSVNHTVVASSSTNPQINQTLPYFCEPVAGSQPVTTISVVASPAAPAITGLTPASGPAAGGGTVTITGSGFEKFVFGPWTLLPQVKFGSVVSPGVQLVSPTELRAIVPAGAAGTTVDVSVATMNGISVNTTADDYTYAAAALRTAKARR